MSGTAAPSRRLVLASLLGTAACASSGAGERSGSGSPNILFILADDFGYGDLSATGRRRAATPHLDRLAAGGLMMTQFYVGSPICSASRAAFMTGRFPAELGFVSFISNRAHNIEMDQADWLDPALPTLPRTLRQAGYATGQFGKWHLGGGRDIGDAPLPAAYGFDDSYVQFEGLGPRLLITEDHYGLSTQSAALGRGPIDYAPKAETTRRYIDRALDFIDRAGARPWYVQLWLDDVHDPWEPTAEQLAAVRGLGRTPDEERFLAVLVAMDAQIGRLIDALRQRGLLEDTLVVFTGDNGPTAAEPYYRAGVAPGETGDHRGRKASLYEGGIRQPLLIHWPGRAPSGQRDDTTVAGAVDLYPTLARIAGLAAPASVDGVDIGAAWRGRPIQRRPDLLFAYGYHGRPGAFPLPFLPRDRSPPLAIRSGRWKLLAGPDGGDPELYDMAKDAPERENVAAAHPALVRRLTARLMAWRATLPPPGWRQPQAA